MAKFGFRLIGYWKIYSDHKCGGPVKEKGSAQLCSESSSQQDGKNNGELIERRKYRASSNQMELWLA